jgi:hypothetical protein
MTTIKVELAVLLSIIKGENILHVTESDVNKVLTHIFGSEVIEFTEDIFTKASNWIKEKNPKVAEAAELTKRVNLDEGRYNSLINLFRMNHQVETMVA